MEQLLAVIDQNSTTASNHEPGSVPRPRSILPGLYPDHDDDDDVDEEDDDVMHMPPGQDDEEDASSQKIACRPAPRSFEPGPAIVDDAGHEFYTVAAVLDWRSRGRRCEYLVDWEGYGPEHRSWEPATELKQHAAIREMIQELHERHPDRPKPGSRPQKRRKSLILC